MKESKKLLIITDTYDKHINGVVRTLDTTAKILREKGFCVEFFNYGEFQLINFGE